MEQSCVTFACNTILDKITNFFLPVDLVNFLNIIIIKTPLIIVNYWSIVHVITGILFFFIWRRYSKNFYLGLFTWTIINIAFEGFEFHSASQGLYPELFKEEVIDITWDFIMNTLGYFIAPRLLKKI